MVIYGILQHKNNHKGLNPANGNSPIFLFIKKVLSDTNNTQSYSSQSCSPAEFCYASDCIVKV